MLFQKMIGFSDEELQEMNYSKFTLPKWNEYEKTVMLDQLLEYGYSDVYQKEYIRKDGTKLPAELRVSMLRDSTVEPVQKRKAHDHYYRQPESRRYNREGHER